LKLWILSTFQLNYPLAEVLRKEVISQSPPFNLIREMIDSYGEEFLDLVSDQETLEKVFWKLLTNFIKEPEINSHALR